MKSTITYLGHYDILRNGKQCRVYSLAGAKKMDYICNQLTKLGYNVNIVSAAFSNIRGQGKVRQDFRKIKKGVNLILAPSNKAIFKFERIKRVLMARFWLFKYLLCNCKKGDYVLVYHSYIDAIAIILAQKIKRFKIILQIEEQYSMVWKLTPFQKWKEKQLLKYGKETALVVSDVLAEKLNIKDPVISYGNYNCYEGKIPEKHNENKILIFTGMIETVRNGAFNSIKSMKYLPSNYVLYLSGPVAESNRNYLEDKIREVNEYCGREACVYLGVLGNDDYEKLLLRADIALNPQDEGEFGEFVFPSKILTYMSYNLPVVSTKGESIIKSKLSKYIIFSEKFTPKSFSSAILQVSEEHEDYRDILKKLDFDFNKKLNEVFKKN